MPEDEFEILDADSPGVFWPVMQRTAMLSSECGHLDCKTNLLVVMDFIMEDDTKISVVVPSAAAEDLVNMIMEQVVKAQAYRVFHEPTHEERLGGEAS